MVEDKKVDTQTTTTDEFEVKFKTQDDYQTEVNRVVGNRLDRTKQELAKKLGIESYSEEALESFVSEYNAMKESNTTFQEKLTTSENTLFDKDLTINALTMGVTKENLDRVNVLVKTEMQTNTELDINGAMEIVLNDFPMFKGQEVPTKPTSVGVQTTSSADAPNEVDAYLKQRYGKSKYYNGK